MTRRNGTSVFVKVGLSTLLILIFIALNCFKLMLSSDYLTAKRFCLLIVRDILKGDMKIKIRCGVFVSFINDQLGVEKCFKIVNTFIQYRH